MPCRASARPSARGEHRDDYRQGQQHDLGRLQAQGQRAGQPDHRDRDGGDGQPDRGHRRSVGEVQADLHPVAHGVANRRDGLRCQHQQSDHYADHRVGQAQPGDDTLDGGESNLARPTVEISATNSRARLIRALGPRAGRRVPRRPRRGCR